MSNYFNTDFLSRHSQRRRDKNYINSVYKDAKTLFIPIFNDSNLFNDEQPNMLSYQQIKNLEDIISFSVFLGENSNNTYFSISLTGDNNIVSKRLSKFGTFQSLRKQASILDEETAGLLAFARAMDYWHRQNLYCGNCGDETDIIEAGFSRKCSNTECQRTFFPRIDPAVIVLVTNDDSCLLGRHSSWQKGLYAVIAGFAEPGERLESAVKRGVEEETGIRVKNIKYHSSQPWPFPCSLMIAFTATAENTEIDNDEDELDDVRWFSRDELKKKLADNQITIASKMSIAYSLISEWMEQTD
ncbi:MAG: NAD(+) diphosphatase [Candidatus Zixiibacteriota bacterium]